MLASLACMKYIRKREEKPNKKRFLFILFVITAAGSYVNRYAPNILWEYSILALDRKKDLQD